ncbi:MAG: hypothetical protein MK081_14265 [Flavobacteriales bacterium]|nr:hypothetical protein [Flavobacteriales bacterium]
MSLEKKTALVNHLIDDLTARCNTITNELYSLSESKKSEQKSSAGDKFETSREMMRQEEEQLQKNIIKLRGQIADLQRVDLEKDFDQIEFGAYAETSMGDFLIASGMGSVTFNGKKYFCISLASPIGRKMHLLQSGESFKNNTGKVVIEAIY